MKNKQVTQNIKSLLPKPSDAIDALIKGITAKRKDSHFTFDMSTYGHYDKIDNMCFGCLATATICNLYKINSNKLQKSKEHNNYIRIISINGQSVSQMINLNDVEFMNFEYSINDLRFGRLDALFKFYEQSDKHLADAEKLIVWDENIVFSYINNHTFDKNFNSIIKKLKNLKKYLIENNL